ncbi:MAG TPA: TIGR03560 family F420-dependent LLM class oxidoreductase [Actinomycetota bacterium]|nr:TIGR03560 family F420-dependent LLM class oxidoreductase [Actinomycetota bacterium]
MLFGLDCSQHQLTWEELVSRVRFAEASGFEGAWVFDHFKTLYGDSDGPCMEGWTLLAALGAVTETIRLGPLVTGITYRHPSILTAEAITVDHISNGRIEFAVGAAWFDQEHRELGVDFPSNKERAGRLEEAVQIMKLLMTTDGASFDGRYYRLENASYHPRPVQQPHIPIWIGANGEKLMLPIVGRHADVWHAFGSVVDLKRKSKIVDDAAEKAGRDPAEIKRSTALSLSEPWDEVKRTIEELAEAGFSYLTVSYPSEGQERLDEFVEKVMPDFADA